jgi:hypothetical protein
MIPVSRIRGENSHTFRTEPRIERFDANGADPAQTVAGEREPTFRTETTENCQAID